MTAAALDRRPRLPRHGDRLPTSFALALAMHTLLFGGMTLAVQWRTTPQAPITAELWSALPPMTVPPPEVAPAPPPPPPKPEPEPDREAEIVLKQEKKAPPKVEAKKEEPKKEEPKKPEPRKDEKKAEAKKAEAKKDEPPRPRTDLERLMAQAGATPAPGGATAAGSSTSSGARGTDAGYHALVIGCIRPHINFLVPEGTAATVQAEFRVELLPDGSVAAVKLLRSSGLAGYDVAAERGIRRCDPFPAERDGKFPRSLTLVLRPVETR